MSEGEYIKPKKCVGYSECSINQLFRRISFLWKSVCALGPLLGLRYWRIMLACEKDPSLVIEWAERCERESEMCKLRGDIGGHWVMDSWAKRLRREIALQSFEEMEAAK